MRSSVNPERIRFAAASPMDFCSVRVGQQTRERVAKRARRRAAERRTRSRRLDSPTRRRCRDRCSRPVCRRPSPRAAPRRRLPAVSPTAARRHCTPDTTPQAHRRRRNRENARWLGDAELARLLFEPGSQRSVADDQRNGIETRQRLEQHVDAFVRHQAADEQHDRLIRVAPNLVGALHDRVQCIGDSAPRCRTG